MKAAAFEGAATDQRTVAVPVTLQAPMNSLTALASPLVSALALVTGLVGVLGARFDLIAPVAGFTLFAFLMPAGLVLGLLLGLIGLLRTRPRQRRGGASQAWGGVLLSAAVLGGWLVLASDATQAAPIHDVTTNIEDPPTFEAAAPHDSRGAGFAYPSGGVQVPDLQRQAYPDLGTASLDLNPTEALWRARHTAEDLGWTQILDDSENGRLEFSDTTAWFGFVDYVAVRVRPRDAGAAVDLRSVSRIGIGDMGKNAARIRHYLDELTSE